MNKKIVQFSIKELVLTNRGPNDDKEDQNLFRFTLSYPAEGISGLETVKTIPASKAIPNDWGADFDKAILFKTELRGKAKLSIEAVSIDKQSAAEKSLLKIFGGIFGAVLGVWTGGFGSAYVGAITKSVGTSITDMVEDEDDIDIIGKANFVVDSEDLPAAIELPLMVEKPVTQKVRKRNPNRGSTIRTIRTDEVVIPAGPNGHLKIEVEILE